MPDAPRDTQESRCPRCRSNNRDTAVWSIHLPTLHGVGCKPSDHHAWHDQPKEKPDASE